MPLHGTEHQWACDRIRSGSVCLQLTSLMDSPDPDQIRRFRTGMAGLDNSFFVAFAK